MDHMTSMTFSPAENDDLIAAETMLSGADMSPIVVDGFLRGQGRAYVTRMLRQMSEELGIVDLVFPRPIMERVAARAVIRRAGRSRRGYRGAHRRGMYTVAAIAADVERQRPAAAAAHRASLRRHVDGMVWIGSRYISVPVIVGPLADEPVATLTLMPQDYDQATITACDDAPTGPLLIDSEEAGSC